ncbi:LysR family transcriptional regulator [Mesorhizobium sp. KR1-2]|uniref:LysR family transcriptional regulator n=1 Tax=Mesorhizobium sp. KR1-2 TaxID=3156609 RepID=UPI0032B3DCF3
MDIRNFAGFVAAAEFMNLTLAARRLNITQSALSRQIQALEAYLGVPLFEKVGRNVRLTSRGEALFAKVNDVLLADRSLRMLAGDLGRGESGMLKVGACSQLIERYFPGFLKSWRQRHPGIDVRIEDGGGAELAGRLRSGAVHLTISARPSAPIDPFETLFLGKLGFMALATDEFLEGPGAPIEIADVLQYPVLTQHKRHASREVFDAACRLVGAVPSIVLESYSPHTLFAMAAGGNGVAIVPSSARSFPEGLIRKPVTLRGELLEFDICAMWGNSEPLPAYGRRFIDELRAHIQTENEREQAKQPEEARKRLEAV